MPRRKRSQDFASVRIRGIGVDLICLAQQSRELHTPHRLSGSGRVHDLFERHIHDLFDNLLDVPILDNLDRLVDLDDLDLLYRDLLLHLNLDFFYDLHNFINLLNYNMYGTRRAALNWQKRYSQVLMKNGFTAGR